MILTDGLFSVGRQPSRAGHLARLDSGVKIFVEPGVKSAAVAAWISDAPPRPSSPLPHACGGFLMVGLRSPSRPLSRSGTGYQGYAHRGSAKGNLYTASLVSWPALTLAPQPIFELFNCSAFASAAFSATLWCIALAHSFLALTRRSPFLHCLESQVTNSVPLPYQICE